MLVLIQVSSMKTRREGIDQPLIVVPLGAATAYVPALPTAGNIGAPLFKGEQRFF
jgi:hypothetical protein